jgi:hypothetical protein
MMSSFSPASRRHRSFSSRSRIRSTSSNSSSRYGGGGGGFMNNHVGRSRASRLASSYDSETSLADNHGMSVLGKSFDRGSPEMAASGFNFGSRWF